jgi:HSP20 family molecular chaperone IbpA
MTSPISSLFYNEEFLYRGISRPALFSTIPVVKGPNPIRYNVLVDEADNSAVYEVALPGYDKSDLEVRYSDNRLMVSSNESETNSSGYVVHMFGKRPFSLSWGVSDAKVSGAKMLNGVLRVEMSRNINDPSNLVPVT